MKNNILLMITLLTLTAAAQARIPVTEVTTVVDANVDGAELAHNYRVADDCDGSGLLKESKSSGLLIFSAPTNYENEVAGVKYKTVEMQYVYMKARGNDKKFKIKTGKISLNNIKKVTVTKKVDDQVVESVATYEVGSIENQGELAGEDGAKASYPITIKADGSMRINGKKCNDRVSLVPTTDVAP